MNVSKRLLLVASFLLATEAIAATPPMVVQPMAVPATNPWLVPYITPAYQAPMPPVFMPFPLPGLPQAGPAQPSKPYSMRRIIPQQEKTQMMQMFLPMMTNMFRMSMPDSMNYFSRKYKVKPGLSFDEVRDSLFLRGNQLNVKKVGENLMWKDFQVVLNDNESPRIEVYSFCDIAVARDLLKISPEFIVFLPCRIAIMEDGNKEIWVLMLDWNMDWVRGYEKQMGLTDELIKKATDLNLRLDEMMRAAANGDL